MSEKKGFTQLMYPATRHRLEVLREVGVGLARGIITRHVAYRYGGVWDKRDRRWLFPNVASRRAAKDAERQRRNGVRSNHRNGGVRIIARCANCGGPITNSTPKDVYPGYCGRCAFDCYESDDLS